MDSTQIQNLEQLIGLNRLLFRLVSSIPKCRSIVERYVEFAHLRHVHPRVFTLVPVNPM